ncbi:ABC transporter substrate-binding protein [Lottiidibacillus patelloidae]|uniref:ABC transporter substrate-binding protein n=1 Tax=Lottiidibacillus patelloidae TaxID=2670334 RepID=A0A263BR55_9BACI|nr:aliphatic sulfonate ABC transporter substrate-binding protein [Lottiidibacillus patelloidae]OZM56164.1 ABC transporter substrate-binding protein [Lottiidibacillus patelloidae]
MKKTLLVLTALFTFAGILAGCGTKNGATDEKIIIGYFPNINHVPAMVAKENGIFEKHLGDGTVIEYRTFPDGSSFMLALTTGEIHAGLVGPGPAMNYYSTGADVKIIAGGSTGGTVVLARKDSGINSVNDFPGKTFITPRVGCTHDVQAETYLKELGITSNRIGGSMSHVTGKPSQYVQMFLAGKVDIAVAPEPWASVLEQETGAKVIIDTDEISFGKTLPASVLVTSGTLINENPALVQKIVDAHMEATAFINESPEKAKEITLKAIKEITGQELSKAVIDSAWNRIGFTYEVNQEAIQAFADSSFHLKFLKEQPDFSDLINRQFISK